MLRAASNPETLKPATKVAFDAMFDDANVRDTERKSAIDSCIQTGFMLVCGAVVAVGAMHHYDPSLVERAGSSLFGDGGWLSKAASVAEWIANVPALPEKKANAAPLHTTAKRAAKCAANRVVAEAIVRRVSPPGAVARPLKRRKA
jgi:hypothetical protein